MRRAVLSLLLLSSPLAAQQPTAPDVPKGTTQPKAAVADTGIFSPLPLPPGNDIRRPNGAPGPRYWQQRADYQIAATLDTATQSLRGVVTIKYSNNSPDTLAFVWMQMDQNLFRPGSTGSLLNAAGSRFGAAGFQGGFEVDRIEQRPAVTRRAPAVVKGAPLKTRTDDTMMKVDLATPLPPGQATVIEIAYHFAIPEHGADRMGRDGSLYELAQWYPRMAVYDDILGWNTDQYLGQGEFYLEYGDFDYEVTVPAGYIVAATGVLQNPLEALTATQRTRLALAARSDTTIHIVTEAEITSGAARPVKDGTQSWRFKASNVRDVAWAAAPNFLWDASSWDGTLTQAYYRPSARRNWSEAARMTQYSIKEYSTRWFRYPWPQMSAIEGPISGMEYPMVAMESDGGRREDLYSVVTHEIGHSWFPMIVGSNERRYAWMDEGFNTFINTFSEEGYFQRDDSGRRRGEAAFVWMNDQSASAQPIITPANRYRNGNNLGSLAYIKPSMMLLTLRTKVLGPDVFDAAFREYTRRWAFKHPTPADFFRSIENVAGRDLSWFWRGWVYTTDLLDQSVDNVTQAPRRDSTVARITIKNLGAQVMPVELTLTLTDGSTQVVRYPVEIWYNGDRYVAVVTTPTPIKSAAVSADGWWGDVNAGNNVWRAPASP